MSFIYEEEEDDLAEIEAVIKHREALIPTNNPQRNVKYHESYLIEIDARYQPEKFIAKGGYGSVW